MSCNSPERKTLSKNKAGQYLDRFEKSNDEPDIRQKYIDSAYAELQSTKQNDSVTRYLYRRALAAYYNLDLYNKSLEVSSDVLEMAEDANDTLDVAKIMYSMGEVYYKKAEGDTAFYYYDQAEKLFTQLNEPGSLGEIILYKAYIYYNIGEYILSEVEAFKALELLQGENKSVHVYNCYNLIAAALDGQDNNPEAIKYYEMALRQVEVFRAQGYQQSVIEFYKATCYNNMGGVYVKMGSNTKAISLYNVAIKFPSIKGDFPSLYAKLLNNLAYAKFKANDDDGLPEMFYTSLQIRENLNNKSGIVASNIHLGEYFATKRDTTLALMYLNSAYKNAKEIKSHFDILNSLKLLSELDMKNSAYYSGRYITVSDSLQNIARANREKYARIEYETDKLQNEKEALIKKNSFIIGLSAIGLLFVAAIFVIYYLNSRNKELLLIQEQQKANEEIYLLMNEQQSKIDIARNEEKNRIAMELHDGILNNIYAVRLNLEFINKKSDEESINKRKEFIKNLQSVETEIRSVSHELSRNAMLQEGKNFENILEYMITSQRNDFETFFETEIDNTIDWDSLSNVYKVNIYRIIQETLQNINKYSEAGIAKVEIKQTGDNINILVTDDGIGFNPDTIKDGIGLKNLKKRVVSLNGIVTIESTPGNGAVISVSLPM